MKRLVACLIMLSLILSVVPVAAFAAEEDLMEHTGSIELEETVFQDALAETLPEPTPVEMQFSITEHISPDAGLPDNDELFFWFVERELYGYDVSLYGTTFRNSLNAAEQGLYDVLKKSIENVALNGGSTVFAATNVPDLKISWTNTELNVPSIDDYKIVETAFCEQFDLDALLSALLGDCPFDLYWYDKTVGARLSYNISVSGLDYGSYVVIDQATIVNLKITFTVSRDYMAAENVVTSNVAKVNTARINAAKVVADNAHKSPYEKMVAYKEYICSAVTYNDAAADKNYKGGYGDPWQLISVFDGDSSTNVVCEGYSKAFQYLCDLGGLECICASGNMVSPGSSGPHMWNVVTLEGKKYLVDVTNCDDGTIGAPDLLFLVGGQYRSGSYTICGASYFCEDLNLEPEKYSPPPLVVCLLGDLDLDGDVDAYDLTSLARHVGGIETLADKTAIANADTDRDGDIDAYDLTKHARFVGGIITSWDQQ